MFFLCRRSFIAIALLILARGAGAEETHFFVTPLFQETLGSGRYVDTSASLDVGKNFHMKPEFDAYHSSTSSGTFRTYSLLAAYDQDNNYGGSVTAGFSPTTNGYKKRFFGASIARDLDFYVAEATAAASLIQRLDFEFGFVHTLHSDEDQLQFFNGRPVVTRRQGALLVGETDLHGIVALTALDTRVGFNFLKAVYDRDLPQLSLRPAQVLQLAGLATTVQGFPNINFNARVDLQWVPIVAPYVSYTYTSYAVVSPISQAYTVGVASHLAGVGIDASYQRFSQRTAADVNYVRWQLSYEF